MKRLLLILLAPLILASCQPRSVTDGKRAWTRYFKKVLKDPESFKVYDEQYQELDEHTVQWTLDYGAKNSYGAMERRTVKFKTTHGLIEIDGNLIDTDGM